jgi:serine/threonine protein kinase
VIAHLTHPAAPRLTMSSTRTLINASIGEYRIVDKLGEGGMGEVYRAVHTKIGRTVAVKLMSHAVANPEFFNRFLNEARIQANLHHPNIVTLYDFCEFDGRPCIIMEYIEGQTLADLIRSRGALPRSEAVPIFRAIVDALSHVHSQGIIHRDIKSNNVKVTNTGEVKLLDFGIAKSGSSPALTMTGAFIGTLQYISPEQFAGGIADARSDIWALGVLLYEMTTGRLPFEADSIGGLYEKINAAAYTPPSALNSQMPRELEPVIGRCLRRNPSERYQTARDLLVDLERAWSMSSTAPTIPSPPQPVQYPAPSPNSSGRQLYSPPQPAWGTPPQIQSYSQPQQSWSTTPVSTGSSGMKWIGLVGVAVLVLAVIIGGGYLMMREGDVQVPTPAGGNQQPAIKPTPSLQSGQPSVPQKEFRIELSEGQADVFMGGTKVGVTPYHFQARPGDQVSVVLKREGYNDKAVDLMVSENRPVYTFTLAKKE